MHTLVQSLARERTRTLFSILAVAAALVFVLVLEGFQAGLWHQVAAYREQWPVQFVEVQQGAFTLNFSRAAVPAEAEAESRTVPGVTAVFPLVGAPSIFVTGDTRTTVIIIGYDAVGGPAHLRSGRQVQQAGEAVLDYALARRHGLQLGDEAPLFGRQFHIVGLSKDTSAILGSYVFVSLQDAYRALAPSGNARPNFLLVQTDPGLPPAQARSAIEQRVAGVQVLTPKELAAIDVTTAKGIMGSLMQVLVIAAYVSGVLIIAATLYAAVAERTRDYGIMKAVGAANARLYALVANQALMFTAAGFGVAVLIAAGIAALFARVLPQYLLIVWEPSVLLRAGIAALLMALVGAALPVRQIHSVDPALVFRE